MSPRKKRRKETPTPKEVLDLLYGFDPARRVHVMQEISMTFCGECGEEEPACKCDHGQDDEAMHVKRWGLP